MAQGKNPGVMFQFTTPVVLAHPNLFTPRRFKDERGVESGEPKYDLRCVLEPDHPDVPALREKLIEAARLAWPNAKFADPMVFPRPAQGSVADPLFLAVDYCLRSGTDIADKAQRSSPAKDREAYRGKFVIVSRGQYAPGLSYPNPNGGGIIDAPMSGPERMAVEKYFYGGVRALVQLQLVGYQVGNNTPVITAYPNIVLSMNAGDHVAAFAGGAAKSGASAFAQYTGHVTQTDPTAGMAAGVSALV